METRINRKIIQLNDFSIHIFLIGNTVLLSLVSQHTLWYYFHLIVARVLCVCVEQLAFGHLAIGFGGWLLAQHNAEDSRATMVPRAHCHEPTIT